MEKALTTDMYALGILYQNKTKVSFNNRTWLYQNDPTPVVKRRRDIAQVNALI
jgi:hypothetical protein